MVTLGDRVKLCQMLERSRGDVVIISTRTLSIYH